ncbi:MAG: FG-GAP-like repeat-containing protein [bacterium]
MKTSFLLIALLNLCSVLKAQQASQFIEHVIQDNFGGACTIASADFDGDGDLDVVATSFDNGYISWLENDGSQNFTEHRIVDNFHEAAVVDVAYIDNDDDIDVIATAQADNKISWFENDGHGNFTEHIIIENCTTPGFVFARDHRRGVDFDINEDGFTDFIATCTEPGDKISWFENDSNQNFTEHILKENWYWVRRASAYDIDQDGDLDIFAGGKAGDVIWFENDGNENFTEHVIIDNWGWINEVLAEDINKDGFVDLVATTVQVNEVAWFENDGAQNFTKHVVKDNYDGAFGMVITDIDEDNDWDIIATAWIAGLGSVFENDGNQNFTQHIFCDNGNEFLHMFLTDIDSDSDIDILGAIYDQSLPELRWWENKLNYINADFDSNLKTGNIPFEVSFTDNSESTAPITSWEWDFDNDGVTDSHIQNPQWTFTEPGYATVSLAITSPAGKRKIVQEDMIHIFNGESSIKYLSAESCVQAEATDKLNLTDNFTIEVFIYQNTNSLSLRGATLVDKENLKIYIPRLGIGGVNKSAIVAEYVDLSDQVVVVQTPANSVAQSIWQQIAVSFNYAENRISIFINGIEQEISYSIGNSFDIPIKDNTHNPLLLGNETEKQMPFNGLLDEFRIWSIAKSGEQILEYLNLSPDPNAAGLSLYYNMNEGNGSTLIDLTPNNNNGTINNCEYWEGVDLSSISDIKDNFYNNSTILKDFWLYQNYPNPFNPTTIIVYTIPKPGHVKLVVYDILGNEIMVLVDKEHNRGSYKVQFDASKLSCGVYFYQFIACNFVETKKMILIE